MAAPVTFELSSFLQNASSHDKVVRDQAEAGLRQMQESDWGQYVTGLAQELANEGKPEQTRQMSSLLLKNLLDAKDAHLKDEKFQKWKALGEHVKSQIRAALLQTISSKVGNAAHGAAMVIAKIAHIELLENAWPDLLPTLQNLVGNEGAGDICRSYALQCLGYVCEEFRSEGAQFPQQETNKILTAIVQGMSSKQSSDIRLAATRALADAIEFASMNFEKQDERDYLMQMICEATIAPDPRIRLAAYQNLVKVADIYYRYLGAYIQTIYQLTTQSFKDSDPQVAMQAIEFWTTIADVEIDLKDMEDAHEVTASSESLCKRYVDTACAALIPLLLDLLTLQSEDQDEDDNEWNVCMSAAVCLTSISQSAGDLVVQPVTEYVKVNVSKQSAPDDWRWREAAMTAFGCIVEGPKRQTLLPFVSEAFHFLVTQGLQDPHAMVKRTTAWTIGRIFEFLHEEHAQPPLVTHQNAGPLVDALLMALGGGPAMAERTCYAIQQLAAGFSANDDAHELTPFFARIVEALMTVAYAEVRLDMAHKLHISAFEAINDVITYAAISSMPFVVEMVPHLLGRIKETFSMTADAMQQRKHELQGQLCAALQCTIRRMDNHPPSKEKLLSQADAIMEALIMVQNSRAAVNEEVMLTMSALCLAQGKEFHKYMQYIIAHLMTGLTRHEEYQVCRVCVNTLGDIAREIQEHLAPWADQIMQQLLTNLQSQELHRDVKPDILSVFGDISQGLGTGFDKYLSSVAETLQAAMNVAYTNQMTYQGDDEPDDALVMYNNDLRLGIVTAAAGILSGVPDDQSNIPQMTGQLLLPFGKHMITFLSLIHQDFEFVDESLRKEAVALLGDICRIPGIKAEFMNPAAQEWIEAFIQQAQDLPPSVVDYTRYQVHAVMSSG